MIVIDTNVISEPVKPLANPAVIAWLDHQPKEELYLSAPVLMEVLLGITQLPGGKRKSSMMAAVQTLLTNYFAGRFLAFERQAAAEYAVLASRAAAKGYAISIADCQIAAIAAIHGFAVATRDTAPFLTVGVPVIVPWKS
ncbi:MAG TPA: type II toxin-antitoxin system VapC family toxin [Terracidiphilus sp.]|nr:type II toxin-antitoxin system VapC family toxin [Terracidiphilus sp.]